MKKPIRQIRVEGNIAYVPLTQGYEAIIDADDVTRVQQWNWCAHVNRRGDGNVRTVYAGRSLPRKNGKKHTALMHRVIVNPPDGMEADHRDGDGLNNRRNNLRVATISQNQHNRRTSYDSASGIKGVDWHQRDGKWRARITLNGKRKQLGLFDDINDAAEAYAKASAEMHGDFGRVS